MANKFAVFRSRACFWISSETLEPAFHRVFIWCLIGEEDSCSWGWAFISNNMPDEKTDKNTAQPVYRLSLSVFLVKSCLVGQCFCLSYVSFRTFFIVECKFLRKNMRIFEIKDLIHSCSRMRLFIFNCAFPQV